MLLAVPIGKAFSRPDGWSGQLSLSPFLATRPLSTGEWLVIKMKVAAVSAITSWSLILAFLSVWLPLWANLDALGTIRIGLWMVYGHSAGPQYLLAVLLLVAGGLLTWKFLVNGLWVGLSGSRRWFVGSAAVYSGIWLAGLICLTIYMNQPEPAGVHPRADPNRALAALEWFLALAASAKLWLAARWWRRIQPARVRRYLLIWISGTCALAVGAALLWADGTLGAFLMSILDFPPLDQWRLGGVLFLGALLVIPFARLGLAPAALHRNRHR